MSIELSQLSAEYREKLVTDPEFYHRTRLTEKVLDELDKVGALVGNKSYAAYLVMAALEKAAVPGPGQEQAWNMGFSAATREWLAQRANPDHPITRENPFRRQ